MAIAEVTGLMSLFGDHVYSSTDLNRRAGEVLNRARKTPVTISRNGEQFALLRREQAAELVRAVTQLGPTLELLEGALSIAEGNTPPLSSLQWLRAFDLDDLRKMIREVLVASSSALHETGDWESVAAIIHEWHESALVAMSGVLDEAMKSPAEREPFPNPSSLLDAENEPAPAP